MSKPIFIIRYGIEDKPSETLTDVKKNLEDFNQHLTRQMDDHHIMVILDPMIDNIQFEYFSSKNINEIELDELKKRVLSEIQEKVEEAVEFDIEDKDAIERAKKYFGDVLTSEQKAIIDQILELEDELVNVREEKNRLVKEREYEKAAIYRDKEVKVLNKIEQLNDQKNSAFS